MPLASGTREPFEKECLMCTLSDRNVQSLVVTRAEAQDILQAFCWARDAEFKQLKLEQDCLRGAFVATRTSLGLRILQVTCSNPACQMTGHPNWKATQLDCTDGKTDLSISVADNQLLDQLPFADSKASAASGRAVNDPDAGSLLDLLPAAADEQELWYEAVQHLQTQAAAGGCLVSRSLPEVAAVTQRLCWLNDAYELLQPVHRLLAKHEVSMSALQPLIATMQASNIGDLLAAQEQPQQQQQLLQQLRAIAPTLADAEPLQLLSLVCTAVVNLHKQMTRCRAQEFFLQFEVQHDNSDHQQQTDSTVTHADTAATQATAVLGNKVAPQSAAAAGNCSLDDALSPSAAQSAAPSVAPPAAPAAATKTSAAAVQAAAAMAAAAAPLPASPAAPAVAEASTVGVLPAAPAPSAAAAASPQGKPPPSAGRAAAGNKRQRLDRRSQAPDTVSLSSTAVVAEKHPGQPHVDTAAPQAASAALTAANGHATGIITTSDAKRQAPGNRPAPAHIAVHSSSSSAAAAAAATHKASVQSAAKPALKSVNGAARRAAVGRPMLIKLAVNEPADSVQNKQQQTASVPTPAGPVTPSPVKPAASGAVAAGRPAAVEASTSQGSQLQQLQPAGTVNDAHTQDHKQQQPSTGPDGLERQLSSAGAVAEVALAAPRNSCAAAHAQLAADSVKAAGTAAGTAKLPAAGSRSEKPAASTPALHQQQPQKQSAGTKAKDMNMQKGSLAAGGADRSGAAAQGAKVAVAHDAANQGAAAAASSGEVSQAANKQQHAQQNNVKQRAQQQEAKQHKGKHQGEPQIKQLQLGQQQQQTANQKQDKDPQQPGKQQQRRPQLNQQQQVKQDKARQQGKQQQERPQASQQQAKQLQGKVQQQQGKQQQQPSKQQEPSASDQQHTAEQQQDKQQKHLDKLQDLSRQHQQPASQQTSAAALQRKRPAEASSAAPGAIPGAGDGVGATPVTASKGVAPAKAASTAAKELTPPAKRARIPAPEPEAAVAEHSPITAQEELLLAVRNDLLRVHREHWQRPKVTHGGDAELVSLHWYLAHADERVQRSLREWGQALGFLEAYPDVFVVQYGVHTTGASRQAAGDVWFGLQRRADQWLRHHLLQGPTCQGLLHRYKASLKQAMPSAEGGKALEQGLGIPLLTAASSTTLDGYMPAELHPYTELFHSFKHFVEYVLCDEFEIAEPHGRSRELVLKQPRPPPRNMTQRRQQAQQLQHSSSAEHQQGRQHGQLDRPEPQLRQQQYGTPLERAEVAPVVPLLGSATNAYVLTGRHTHHNRDPLSSNPRFKQLLEEYSNRVKQYISDLEPEHGHRGVDLGRAGNPTATPELMTHELNKYRRQVGGQFAAFIEKYLGAEFEVVQPGPNGPKCQLLVLRHSSPRHPTVHDHHTSLDTSAAAAAVAAVGTPGRKPVLQRLGTSVASPAATSPSPPEAAVCPGRQSVFERIGASN